MAVVSRRASIDDVASRLEHIVSEAKRAAASWRRQLQLLEEEMREALDVLGCEMIDMGVARASKVKILYDDRETEECMAQATSVGFSDEEAVNICGTEKVIVKVAEGSSTDDLARARVRVWKIVRLARLVRQAEELGRWINGGREVIEEAKQIINEWKKRHCKGEAP